MGTKLHNGNTLNRSLHGNNNPLLSMIYCSWFLINHLLTNYETGHQTSSKMQQKLQITKWIHLPHLPLGGQQQVQ